ncbi:hypothetical protein LDENG_00004820 [Lucifuga dentata]|nr:hypothetical protein LDENG_00004820 [Lucifuga dentata]
MEDHTTIPPYAVAPEAVTQHMPYPEIVTQIMKNGTITDYGDSAAIIGGIVAAVMLILICMIVTLLWLMSRQKGSYVTNETDNEESDGSGMALQSKEALEIEEDE